MWLGIPNIFGAIAAVALVFLVIVISPLPLYVSSADLVTPERRKCSVGICTVMAVGCSPARSRIVRWILRSEQSICIH
jgi:hypothetical protein